MISHARPLKYQLIIDAMNTIHEWMDISCHDDIKVLEFSPCWIPVSVDNEAKVGKALNDCCDDQWMDVLLENYSGTYFLLIRKGCEYFVARDNKILQMKDLNLNGFNEIFEYMAWGDLAICDTKFCVPLLVALDLANTGVDFMVFTPNETSIDGI